MILLCSIGCLGTQNLLVSAIMNAEITGMYHHSWFTNYIFTIENLVNLYISQCFLPFFKFCEPDCLL